MSKDTTNLRLLGSPVNFTYRNKKKDRNNIRNRPRSALQNSCLKPDNQERFKRPFSADTKEPPLSLYKTFSSELLEYHYPTSTLKVLPPTQDILGPKRSENSAKKDHCSNASDYGSEDTFISLGTKIKAKAQQGKPKNSPSGKNAIKYRNIAKRGRKFMDNPPEEKTTNEYGMEIKITDKPQRVSSPVRNRDRHDRTHSPLSFKKGFYDAYFLPLQGSSQQNEEDLSGRVSFGPSNVQAEVEEAIDTYNRRLTLTKQQLSLVEEESTQDIENTLNSQHVSRLSPVLPLDANKDGEIGGETAHNTYVIDEKDDTDPRKIIPEPRTYASFFEDFRRSSFDFNSKSGASATDGESKDSGYPDSGTNEVKSSKHNWPQPGPSTRKSNSFSCHLDRLQDQPKSLESTSSTEKDYNTFPLDKRNQWVEPLNHSRLLYKDFFLRKEGHVALPPQNSPVKENNIPDSSAKENNNPEHDENKTIENINEIEGESSDYPPYLLNSTTKAYTSKVIEDYKKELEAINSLHELTLKDIKTDPVSPTPFNIDVMFAQHSSSFTDHNNRPNKEPCAADKIKNTLDTTKSEISKVSTKELIQNYLKVKEGDPGRDNLMKALKKYEPSKKYVNVGPKVDTNMTVPKQDWNNKATLSTGLVPKPVSIRNQTQKNLFTVVHQPVSARLDSTHTDKEIDSWMSLCSASPWVESEPLEIPKETRLEVPRLPDAEVKPPEFSAPNSLESKSPPNNPLESTPRPEEKDPGAVTSTSSQEVSRKDLQPNSTVMDIYSMLKEIESFGDNPVTSVVNAEIPESSITSRTETNEEHRTATPRDNFTEIFEFLEKVEQSASDALNVVTTPGQQSIPKLEALLRLPHTELAQRMVTASLQLEERSCCISLLQESLTNHKEQMIQKISHIEKQATRNISKVKQECEETIKRHQNFIDQLINDKKTLNHRIEQLVDERRSLEERWKRSAQALEERYKLELKNQHDKMAAAQQVARQRWVRQKAEKIKELTVKGLEGELREMAERQQKEVSDLKMCHAELTGRLQAKHSAELEELRRTLEDEKEAALVKERQLASARLEKQILELELTYQEQRTRLVAEMRAENERAASSLTEREKQQREEMEKWRVEQEKLIMEKRVQLERDMAKEREKFEEQLREKEKELEQKFEKFKKDFEAEQQIVLKKKVAEIAAQHKMERDREIEKAIESMDSEAQAGRRELQEAMRRNKEQYELELKELAETEQATLRRYQEAQARIRHSEDRCAELEVTINQLETRNKILTERNIQLEKQMEEIRSECDKAWLNKVDSLNREMEDVRKTHDEQMHQLYAKVKVAVARKDSAIQALTRETNKAQEKIALLEQKLQQQRKDFLKSK